MTATTSNEALSRLSAGDIFHSEYPNGTPQLCIVTAVTSLFVHAWDIPRGQDYLFDKASGTCEAGEERLICRIVCVAPLPAAVRATFLGMYERYRFGEGEERLKLTLDERASLRMLDEFVAAHRLTDVPPRPLDDGAS